MNSMNKGNAEKALMRMVRYQNWLEYRKAKRGEALSLRKIVNGMVMMVRRANG